LKFPGILADVGIAFLIYSYWKNKGKRQMGLILSVVWSLLPISFYSSSIWGQTDSLVNLLGLIGIYFLLKRKLHYFSVFFTLSFLYKPSLAVFIPVLLLYIYKQHYSLKHFLQSTMLSLSLIIFFSFLFHPQLDSLFWLIRLYLEKILPGEVGYLTANAFNFWWLINPGRVLDSTILYLVPARILGYFLTFIFLLPVLLRLLRSKSPRPEILLVALFLSSFTFFVFMTRIHERYLYPVFPILTLLLGYLPKLWVLYITLGVIHLFNLYYLFWAPSLPVLETFQKNTPFMNVLFSFATVLLFFVFYLYFLFFNRFFKFHMRADLAHLDV
jgi:Gpi18-like mannosyltransferase